MTSGGKNGAWWTFCAGSFTCFLTGFTYTFGEWSPVVKHSFSYSQVRFRKLSSKVERNQRTPGFLACRPKNMRPF